MLIFAGYKPAGVNKPRHKTKRTMETLIEETTISLWLLILIYLCWGICLVFWQHNHHEKTKLKEWLKEKENDYKNVKNSHDFWYSQSQGIKQLHIQCTDELLILKSDYSKSESQRSELEIKAKSLESLTKTLRAEIAELKDSRRVSALEYAIASVASPVTDHNKVVSDAKAYYRFLIGKA